MALVHIRICIVIVSYIFDMDCYENVCMALKNLCLEKQYIKSECEKATTLLVQHL